MAPDSGEVAQSRVSDLLVLDRSFLPSKDKSQSRFLVHPREFNQNNALRWPRLSKDLPCAAVDWCFMVGAKSKFPEVHPRVEESRETKLFKFGI